MDGGRGRKLVQISEEIIRQIEEASREENCSIHKFIERGSIGIMRAYEMGYSPCNLIDMLEVLQIYKNFGGVMIPRAVFTEFLEFELNDQERAKLLDRWYESGRWHGMYLSRTSDEPLSTFKLFLESVGQNLNEVEIREEENNLKLICVSSTISAEETEMLSKFISGALCGMNYSIEEEDIMTGMIILDCVNRGSSTQHNKTTDSK